MRWLSLSGAVSVAVLAWLGYTLSSLASIAVPPVPSLTNPDGSSKPLLLPLWSTAPALAFDLYLSLLKRRDKRAPELHLLHVDGLQYGWDLGTTVQLEFEVVRAPFASDATAPTASQSEDSWNGLTPPAHIAAPAAQLRSLLAASSTGNISRAVDAAAAAGAAAKRSPVGGEILGLRVYCKDVDTAAGSLILSSAGKQRSACDAAAAALDAAYACTRNSRSGLRAAAGSASSTTTAGASSIFGRGFAKMVSAAGGVATALSGSGSEAGAQGDSGGGVAAADDGTGMVLLAELIAGRSALTSRSGHAGAYGASELACPAAADGVPDASIARRSKDADAAQKIARAIVTGHAAYAHSAVYWEKPASASSAVGSGSSDDPLNDPLRAVAASTPLVIPMTYTPSRPRRFLWADPSGARTAAWHAGLHAYSGLPTESAARTVLTAPGGRAAGGMNRLYLNTSASPLDGTPQYTPASGHPWPHWSSQLGVTLVMDTQAFPRDEVPPQLRPFLRTDPTGSKYIPLLAANPIRPPRESFLPLNTSIAAPLPLRVSLAPTSVGKWQLLQLLDASLAAQHKMGATDRDTDEVVHLVSDTPLWLLTLTFVVSMVHLLFDGLALASDVSFWSNARSLRGISVRSLTLQFISQSIISAFLWEEGASLLVLLPQVAFNALLVWKIAIAAGFRLTTRFWVVPWIRRDADLAASASEAQSSEYDRQAVVMMSALLAPLLLGFAVYSFAFQQFAGWPDFVLRTAVSAVYGFGFALMVPQVWLNYKLKTVAHMPWRVLGFRFASTFIDDLFAFMLRMPTAHRLAVFRDDIIFIVFLVQRWIYPVDMSRPAEGYDAEESAAATSAAIAAASTPSAQAARKLQASPVAHGAGGQGGSASLGEPAAPVAPTVASAAVTREKAE